MNIRQVSTWLVAAAALGLAGTASAEREAVATSTVVKKVNDDSVAPATRARKESKASKSVADAKRSVASSTGREGTGDPYAVPLFKDARQMR